MMTRQEQFQEELKALLGRYDAEISVEYNDNDDDRPIIEFYSQPDSYEDDGSPVGGIYFWCAYFDKNGY